MLKSLFRVSFIVLVVGQVAVLRAQVFNAPAAGSVQPAGGAAVAQTGAVEQTGWGLPMPKITMPKLTMPTLTMPSMGAVTGPFKSGFSKVTSGTKKAWEGTKEIFSFGQNKTATTSLQSGQQQPSFWQRLLVRESKTQVPQTVGEFMSQPRLDP